MSSSDKRICKIYIHDLDVKTEVRVRQKILMCGAQNATSVRFDGTVNSADIWILNEGSAFKAVAQKKQKKNKFSLWINKNTDIYFSDGTADNLLDAAGLARAVDAVVTGRKVSINKKVHKSVQKKSPSLITQKIKQGIESHTGTLCLEYKSTILFFDFSNAMVHYNEAGKSLLWGDVTEESCLHDFKCSKTASISEELSFNCSMFCAIWQLCHRDSEASLLDPLDRNSALELKSWPTLELVEHEYDHCRIASFLQKRSLSAEQVTHLLKLDKDLVIRFFNSIYLSSYAQFDEASVAISMHSELAVADGLTSLWKRVRGVMQFRKQIRY